MAWNRASKYGAQRTLCQLNHSHRSKLEASVCQLIQLREIAGELKITQIEDHVYLSDAEILYIPDFRCQDPTTYENFWIEAKGFETARWPIIKKLWRVYGPGRLEIWKGTANKPHLDEIIIPKRD